MVKAMLEAASRSPSPPLRILCLCFTNHALDSFLEALLDAKIPEDKFVRLGSSPKISERLKPRCLGEIAEDEAFAPSESRIFAGLKTQQEVLERRILVLQKQMSHGGIWGKNYSWWRTIKDFLKRSYPAELDELRVPKTEDFIQVGKKNQRIEKNYLWTRWCEGKDRGVVSGKLSDESIWKLNLTERRKRKDEWNEEWAAPVRNELLEAMEELRSNYRQMSTLKEGPKIRALQRSTIIGCTTVTAAKLHSMLTQVAPTVNTCSFMSTQCQYIDWSA